MSNAVTTPPVRVSFPTIFTPRAVVAGQTPKYGIVMMFEKGDKDHMASLKQLNNEAELAKSTKWPDQEKAPRIPMAGHDLSPIKDGDKALNKQGVPIAEKNPEYAGHWIIRANSLQQPIVVDRNKAELLDKSKVYGGCYCKVNINPFAYDTSGNRGVTFGLNGVQLWADGESFGTGRPKVDDMFDSAGADNPDNYDGKDDNFFGGDQTTGESQKADEGPPPKSDPFA